MRAAESTVNGILRIFSRGMKFRRQVEVDSQTRNSKTNRLASYPFPALFVRVKARVPEMEAARAWLLPMSVCPHPSLASFRFPISSFVHSNPDLLREGEASEEKRRKQELGKPPQTPNLSQTSKL